MIDTPIGTVWTPERVREDLPDVQVRLADRKTIVKGSVRGRRNEFATVFLTIGGNEVREEFAWSTISRCLNNRTPLQLL